MHQYIVIYLTNNNEPRNSGMFLMRRIVAVSYVSYDLHYLTASA
ncbi:hypothetical protein [Proteus vulgaris]|nr:hypothetical protein [Proteus vulgaris]